MDERINQAYQQLTEHKGIGLVFVLSIVLRIIVPIFLPSINEIFYFNLIVILCVLLPIFLFFRLKRDVIETLLIGTLSYKRAIILGSIAGMTFIAIFYFFLMNLTHWHIAIPAFRGAEIVDLLKKTFYENLKNYRSPADFFIGLWQLLYACILGPLSEEIIFQGWLQTKFSKKMGAIQTVFWVTTIFMFCHREINPFMFVTLLLFAIIQMKTGSLLACTVAHGLINFGKFSKIISFCLLN